MPLTASDIANQIALKQALQAESDYGKFEDLAAALVGRMLDVPIAVAKSGFQHGGDAGPAGVLGRRFRLECKKYSDTTSLSDRELLGEIDHALARDDALEAWILVATRSVPEQLAQDLSKKGERLGIPILIIDWTDHELAPMAALCASNPDVVKALFSDGASSLARALQPQAASAITLLRRSLQAWCLGYATIRAQSHERLAAIWSSPRISNAELGQNAAGGSEQKKVRRASVHTALDSWWQGSAVTDAPAAVFGFDGVGKTWAVLDWLTDQKDNQPIVLVVPSSAVTTMSSITETTVKRLLAERLYELSGVRDADHWTRRLDYLLKRPAGEGPVVTVLLDGLNQEPSVPWLQLFKVLQSDTFSNRVRAVATTRTHYFEDRLARLRGLVVPTTAIPIATYDTTPGGELDQMLGFEGLSRSDLHPDLLELARTPRLFSLVMRVRDRLVEAGHVTVHRLLWEYGRDTLGVRAGRSFSDAEWEEWLKTIAKRYRAGIEEYSLRDLADTASRPDLTSTEVYARLSDIIDGQFAAPGPSGSMQLVPTVVAHALGVAMLAHLAEKTLSDADAIDAEVTKWLDPIAGLDQRAEILRASVSILAARVGTQAAPTEGVLVAAWLQTQNITDAHRRELAALASLIPGALLDAVERSRSSAQRSARIWAINALRAIPRVESSQLATIIARARQWLLTISRDVEVRRDPDSSIDKSRSEGFKTRIGFDHAGSATILGLPVVMADRADIALQVAIPAIIEGFPLAKVLPCFEAAAVANAVRGRMECWEGLKWLCFLNEVDPADTAIALRQLAAQVKARAPETLVHAELPARASALLLWLSGVESDQEAAASINPTFDHRTTYAQDYLPSPGRSWFALERRHAVDVLSDTSLSLGQRMQRTKDFWIDPTFIPPQTFIDEVRDAATRVDVTKLYRLGSYTIEDHHFEDLEPVLARCVPEALADLANRRVESYAERSAEARYWSAIRATDSFVTVSNRQAAAARTLLESARESSETDEAYVASRLLMLELPLLNAQDQFGRIIAAGLTFISLDFAHVLSVLTTQDIDDLIARYQAGTAEQQRDLSLLLSIHRNSFSDSAWSWMESRALTGDPDLRGTVFQILTEADAARFGRTLLNSNWSWSSDADPRVNDYGTDAIIKAGTSLPFEHLAPRLAPWRLLEAAHLRGSDAAETRLAAEIFGHVLTAGATIEPDPGSDLSIDRADAGHGRFVISVEPRRSPEDQDNLIAALNAARNRAAQLEAHRRAADTAIERIREVRRSGASLYLTDVDVPSIASAIRHVPELVANWIEGYEERTNDFRRRVRLAEPAFLALCEGLLAQDPVRGVALWRSLRATLHTRYIGRAGVDDLLHMLFRVPDSTPVSEARDALLGLESCATDQGLFDLALVATLNGKQAWLSAAIESDKNSSLEWRQMRALVLEGFRSGSVPPIDDAWPADQVRTSRAALRYRSARHRLSEGCSHHWWRSFLSADDPAAAYAAWILFCRSADQRAWVWMAADVSAHNRRDALFERKLQHAELNRSRLERGMKKNTEGLTKKFLDRDTLDGVGPWGKVAS